MSKILVVDDHALVRAGLAQVLQDLLPDEPTEVLQASNCAQAFQLAQAHADLDLVLLDYHLPDMNGSEALQVFADKHPDVPVVILSGSVSPRMAQQVLGLGAAGFVTKSGLSEELLHALRQVLAGEIYAPPQLLSATPNAQPAQPIFTPRQTEVLHLLANGLSNRDIALQLGMSEETVKNHITSLLRGFQAKNRMQVALHAQRMGYGQPPSA